jgi:hypothetical protein
MQTLSSLDDGALGLASLALASHALLRFHVSPLLFVVLSFDRSRQGGTSRHEETQMTTTTTTTEMDWRRRTCDGRRRDQWDRRQGVRTLDTFMLSRWLRAVGCSYLTRFDSIGSGRVGSGRVGLAQPFRCPAAEEKGAQSRAQVSPAPNEAGWVAQRALHKHPTGLRKPRSIGSSNDDDDDDKRESLRFGRVAAAAAPCTSSASSAAGGAGDCRLVSCLSRRSSCWMVCQIVSLFRAPPFPTNYWLWTYDILELWLLLSFMCVFCFISLPYAGWQ